MNSNSDELLKQAYDTWQQAMQKAAKKDDESVFVWSDYEGLTYRHLPPPIDVDVAMPHMDAFHQYWVRQKQQPGFGIASCYHKDLSLDEDTIQLFWIENNSGIDKISSKKSWLVHDNAEKIINYSGVHVLNLYNKAIRHGEKSVLSNWQSIFLKNEFDYFLIDAAALHNRGAAPTWEIGIALAMAEELLTYAPDKIAIASKLLITTGVGVMQLLEIAKLRALRFGMYNLLGSIVEEAPYTPILASTSDIYFSNQDIEINLIRHTSEAISAVCGGADYVLVKPHNGNVSDSDAVRLANNIALLLKEEAHLDKVIDPYAGSYYLEQQTDTLAKKAWEHYLQIKEAGGFSAALNTGLIQHEIKQYRNKLHHLFQHNQIIGIGINKYKSSFAKSVDAPNFSVPNKTEIEVLSPFYLFE
jgi:hypothetical protein